MSKRASDYYVGLISTGVGSILLIVVTFLKYRNLNFKSWNTLYKMQFIAYLSATGALISGLGATILEYYTFTIIQDLDLRSLDALSLGIVFNLLHTTLFFTYTMALGTDACANLYRYSRVQALRKTSITYKIVKAIGILLIIMGISANLLFVPWNWNSATRLYGPNFYYSPLALMFRRLADAFSAAFTFSGLLIDGFTSIRMTVTVLGTKKNVVVVSTNDKGSVGSGSNQSKEKGSDQQALSIEVGANSTTTQNTSETMPNIAIAKRREASERRKLVLMVCLCLGLDVSVVLHRIATRGKTTGAYAALAIFSIHILASFSFLQALLRFQKRSKLIKAPKNWKKNWKKDAPAERPNGSEVAAEEKQSSGPIPLNNNFIESGSCSEIQA